MHLTSQRFAFSARQVKIIEGQIDGAKAMSLGKTPAEVSAQGALTRSLGTIQANEHGAAKGLASARQACR
jgi:hypothetical protein